MQRRQAEVEERLQEVEQIKKSQFEMLEKVSGFSKEQAKEYMLQMLENELTHEKALKITQYEQQLKEESDEKAREILSTAIQRCASDHVAEVTVSVVPLPNDEMKGRIIGREGRNIRTLENLTGVDLIIDDTPRPSPFPATIPSSARWHGSPLKSSSRMGASTPPASRKRWKRPAARWRPRSSRTASAPSSKPAYTTCTPS